VRYGYDAAGNIVSRDTEEGAYTYGYDALYRLTSAVPPAALQQPGNAEGLPVETYRYDGVHNRIESGHQPGNWSYNGNNELLRFGEDAELSVREYDSQGLTISDSKGDPLQERTEYGYNAAERLSEVRRGTAQPLPLVATYQYDPFGRRMAKRVGGEATYFVYSEQALVWEVTGQDTQSAY